MNLCLFYNGYKIIRQDPFFIWSEIERKRERERGRWRDSERKVDRERERKRDIRTAPFKFVVCSLGLFKC